MDDLKNVFDKIEKAEALLKELEEKREHEVPEKKPAQKLNKEHQSTIDHARQALASIKDKLSKELAVRTLELDKCQEELVLLQTRLKVGEITQDVYETKSKHLVEKIKSLEKKVVDTQNIINAKFAENVVPIIESDVAVPAQQPVPAVAEAVKPVIVRPTNPETDVIQTVPELVKPAVEPAEIKSAEKLEQIDVTAQEVMQAEAAPKVKTEQAQTIAQDVVPAMAAIDVRSEPAAAITQAPAQAGSPEQIEIKPVDTATPSAAVAGTEVISQPAVNLTEATELKKTDKKSGQEIKSREKEKEPVTLKQHKPSFHLHPLNEPPHKKSRDLKTDMLSKNRALWVIAAAILAGLLLISAVLFVIPRTGSNVGNVAPDFVMQLSSDNMSALSSFRGKNVMLVFWDRDFWDNQFFYVNGVARKLYTPDKINQIYDKVPRSELAIIAIASGTSNSEVDKLIKEYDVKFPVIVDSFGKLRQGYNITEEPTYIFLDKGGVIRARVEGPLISLSSLEQIVYSISKNSEVKPVKPPITDVLIQSVTEKSAVINWSTSTATTTQVDIDGKNIQTVITAGPTTLHSLTLRDLDPGTSYHVRIAYNINNINVSEHSFSALNDTVVSKRYNVATSNKDTVYPEISGINTGFVTDSTITVSWKTDEPTTGNVDYGTGKTYENTATQGSNMSIWHTVIIKDLKPDTLYSLKLRAKDAGGKETIQELEAVKTTSMVETAPSLYKRAPDLTLDTLDGTKLTLSQFKGKRVLLNFWLEGCPPCEMEMPLLQTAYNKYNRDELVILAVNVRGDVDKVRNYIGTKNFTFPVLLDTQGNIDAVYRAPYFPTSYFIDSTGVIRHIVSERFQNISEIDDILAKLE